MVVNVSILPIILDIVTDFIGLF